MNEPDPNHDELDDLDDPGIVTEFIEFLRHNRKYFLIPILLVFLILGILLALGGTSAAPFIYTFW